MIGVPVAIFFLILLFTLIIAGTERDWTFMQCLFLVTSSVCELGNPITNTHHEVPATAEGKVILGICGVVTQGLVGCIVGIVSGMQIFTRMVRTFERLSNEALRCVPSVEVVAYTFLVAPVLVLVLSLAFGLIIGAVFGWYFVVGFW